MGCNINIKLVHDIRDLYWVSQYNVFMFNHEFLCIFIPHIFHKGFYNTQKCSCFWSIFSSFTKVSFYGLLTDFCSGITLYACGRIPTFSLTGFACTFATDGTCSFPSCLFIKGVCFDLSFFSFLGKCSSITLVSSLCIAQYVSYDNYI